MKKTTILLALALTTSLSSYAQNPELYKDSSQPTDVRVENLLEQMTLEEKIHQLDLQVMGENDNVNNVERRGPRKERSPLTGGYIYSGEDTQWANEVQKDAVENSRLGIPLIIGMDVIHGFKTIFPIPLAQSCTWDPALVTEGSSIAAKEAYYSGLRWTFSPMIDVARDSRWGRVAEGYGEDPYAASVFGVAAVKGYQGANLSDKYSIAACLKHYAGYAYSQGGRDYRPTEISPVALWETVFPPYQACIKAGAATIMTSFNDLNGIPTVANNYINNEILKGRWGFEGFVVSDWGAVRQLLAQRYVDNEKEAGVKSLIGGTDMDMCDDIYVRYFAEAVEEGILSEEQIDNGVRRILRVKFELGLFENPYAEVIDKSERYLQPSSLEAAQVAAEKSMVLLKNKRKTLPFSSKVETITLVGAMSVDQANLLGSWSCKGDPNDVVTIKEGLEAEFGENLTINYVEGAEINSNSSKLFSSLKKAASKSDLIVVAVGEDRAWSGENGSVSSIALPTAQEELVKAAKATGKPVVLLLVSGRPVELCRIEPMCDAIVAMWQPGTRGGNAVAGILSGRVNPSGRLSITFPYSTGQIPIYYNQRESARGGEQGDYKDITTEPMYTFGDGLSYSKFEYSDITLSKGEITSTNNVTATVTVTNSSEVDGEETVFWYVDDVAASITQPIKKLKYFEKAQIKAGESRTFTFKITPSRDLSFVDGTGVTHLESGKFNIIVKDKSAALTLK